MTASWQIPAHLRPGEQPPAELSEGAKLIAAQAALRIVVDATDPERGRYGPADRKRWSQRDRLEYIRSISENVLRRIKP
jgi:hypothetical protein